MSVAKQDEIGTNSEGRLQEFFGEVDRGIL